MRINLELLIIGFAFIFNACNYKFNNPDPLIYPVRGIDISHHQGRADWNKLIKQGISFVYIKATEGGDFKDSLFNYNWEAAKKAGIKRGGYHFFTFCKTGKEQAENFIAVVPTDTLCLPPAIDIELGGNCTKRPSKDEFKKELDDYIKEIENIYHQKPVLYVTNDSYKTYIQGIYNDYPVWIRNIFSEPFFKDNRHWTFWQYDNRCSLEGIEGLVDMNVFNGTVAEFEKF